MDYILPDLNLLEIKTATSDEEKTGIFTIEPLSPGYGVTIGNTLRRILLASLEGYAIKKVKIEGVDHEYSTIKGMKEDVVDLILNLKTARFKLNSDEAATLELSAKGPKVVTTSDLKPTSEVDVVSEDQYLCTLEKGAKLNLEIEVDKGRGYVPVERRTDEKMPIGTILVDSIYTPVKKVKYDVENARVGGMTNYNRLVLEITTDGSVTPAKALSTAAKIMGEHLQIIVEATDNQKIKVEKAPRKKKSLTVPEKTSKKQAQKVVKEKTKKNAK
ncbi:MAG: DNA-directed RNA polymerase subunit alpha [Candidatus Berkelbacteria bacterium]|nr:DNA-directed RNA polymerase subunit alpha [Candidatus Berkelbacteria bacterium]